MNVGRAIRFRVVSFVAQVAGFAVLFTFDWKIFVGAFLLVLGANLDRIADLLKK